MKRWRRGVSKWLLVLVLFASIGAANMGESYANAETGLTIQSVELEATENSISVKNVVVSDESLLGQQPFNVKLEDAETGEVISESGWNEGAIRTIDLDEKIIKKEGNFSQMGEGDRIVCDSKGHIYVVLTNGNALELYKSIDFGTTWSRVNVPMSGETDPYYPSIAIDKNDRLYLTYTSKNLYNNSEVYLKLKKSTDGGVTWSNANAESNTSNQMYRTVIRIDKETNHVYLMWGSGYYKYIKSTNFGETWTSAKQLDTGWGSSFQVSNNAIVLAYNKDSYGISELWFKRSEDGGNTWSSEARLTKPSSYHSSSQAIVQDNNKKLHFVYYSTEGPSMKYSSSSDQGKTWSEPVNISIDGKFTTRANKLLCDKNNTLHLIGDGGSPTSGLHIQVIHRKSFDNGATWSQHENLTSNSNYGSHMSSVSNNLDDFEIPLTTWIDNNGCAKVSGKATIKLNTAVKSFEGLSPNKIYKIEVQVKDKEGAVQTTVKTASTKAEAPNLTIKSKESDRVVLTDQSKNPSNTEYKFFIDGKYVDKYGVAKEGADGEWYSITSKSFIIRELVPGGNYKVKAIARNLDNAETAYSEVTEFRTSSKIELLRLDTSVKASEVAFDILGKDNTFGVSAAPYRISLLDEKGEVVSNEGQASEWIGTIKETIDWTAPITIVDQAYSTAGNGSRKAVRLDNGWFVCAVGTGSRINFYVSKNNGETWQELAYTTSGSSAKTMAISSSGNMVHVVNINAPNVLFTSFDATTVSNVDLESTKQIIESGQPSFQLGMSIATNKEGTKITACWSSKNAAYPNSFNIRTAQGTISNGVVTWGTVQQVTNANIANVDLQEPSITYNNDNNPVIVNKYGTAPAYRIECYKWTGSAWVQQGNAQNNTEQEQSNPSISFMPPSAAVLINASYTNGLLLSAWEGKDSTHGTPQIFFSYSSDNGVTWAVKQRLTDKANNQLSPTVSWNDKGRVFIFYYDQFDGQFTMQHTGDLSAFTTEQVSNGGRANGTDAATTIDNYHDFEKPMAMWWTNSDIKFYGKWTTNTDEGKHTQNNLIPNTKYKVKLDIKNAIGEIATFFKDVVTLNAPSVITADATESGSSTITIEDINPLGTEYRLYASGKYISTTGGITDYESGGWYKLQPIDKTTNKTFKITGLQPGKEYEITCESINKIGTVTERSAVRKIITQEPKPNMPVIRKYEVTDTTAKIYWDKIEYADSYEITLVNKTVGSNESFTFKDPGLSYEFTGLTKQTVYEVKITAENEVGKSEISLPMPVKTKDAMPAKMTLNSAVSNNGVKLTWTSVTGAHGYEVFADGQVIRVGKKIEYSHEGVNTLSQHIYKVRAYNGSGYGQWSDMKLVLTGNDGAVAVTDVKAETEDREVVLSWGDNDNDGSNDLVNGYTFDIEFDAFNFRNVRDNFCRIKGLEPGKTYDYTIRVKNQYGVGVDSTGLSITTKKLATPTGVNIEETETAVILTWESVDNATGYYVRYTDKEGIVQERFEPTSRFKDTGLGEVERRNYSVRAEGLEGIQSAYSSVYTGAKVPKMHLAPAKIYALAIKDAIKIMWDAVTNDDGLKVVGYEVEIDDITMDNGTLTEYYHGSLAPMTQHKYRVRAISEAIEGQWSNPIIMKTLNGIPEKPQNISIQSTKYVAALAWDKEEDAFYKLEIKWVEDGQEKKEEIDLGTKNKYPHRRLKAGVEYSYRLMAYNAVGNSPWSGEIINNHLLAGCQKNEAIDLGLTASEVADFDDYLLKVTFNGDALKIDDLSAYTADKELAVGNIEGTDIEITDLREGQITFKVNKAIEDGYTWSGVINSIRFIPVLDGGTNISYVVEKLN